MEPDANAPAPAANKEVIQGEVGSEILAQPSAPAPQAAPDGAQGATDGAKTIETAPAPASAPENGSMADAFEDNSADDVADEPEPVRVAPTLAEIRAEIPDHRPEAVFIDAILSVRADLDKLLLQLRHTL